MNINSPFPEDPDALIAQLETIFPDQVPRRDDSDRDVWIKVGQVSVVSFLRAWRKAYLEKQPYVRRKDTKGEDSGGTREASSGVHEQVLREPRRRRPRRKSRSKRPAN